MKLVPVALALFYRKVSERKLEIWTQVREDDGIYHGLLEFPGGGIEANETPLAAVVREDKIYQQLPTYREVQEACA